MVAKLKSITETPDGRYIVVDGRLWRRCRPGLEQEERKELVSDLMSARRDVKRAMRESDTEALQKARNRVRQAKTSLGERGPVWWDDDAPDLNRHLVKNTVYASWYSRLQGAKASSM